MTGSILLLSCDAYFEGGLAAFGGSDAAEGGRGIGIAMSGLMILNT